MTTIAWDGKSIAGDRQFSHHSRPIPKEKVFATVTTDGEWSLFGAAGCSYECLQFMEWKTKGGEKPTFTEITVLMVDHKKRIWMANEKMIWHPIDQPFYAIGSGSDYAMGAMATGANAERAIEIASQFDTSTGLGVKSILFP